MTDFTQKKAVNEMRYLRLSKDLRSGDITITEVADYLGTTPHLAQVLIDDVRARHGIAGEATSQPDKKAVG